MKYCKSRYKDFTNLAADIAWETERGNITYISGKERFGYKNSQIIGLKPQLLQSTPASSKRYFKLKTPQTDLELVLKHASGDPATLQVSTYHFLISTVIGKEQGNRKDVTLDRYRDIELAAAQNREGDGFCCSL